MGLHSQNQVCFIQEKYYPDQYLTGEGQSQSVESEVLQSSTRGTSVHPSEVKVGTYIQEAESKAHAPSLVEMHRHCLDSRRNTRTSRTQFPSVAIPHHGIYVICGPVLELNLY